MLREFAKRPIMANIQYPEDFKGKWVVASQIVLPAQASNVVHEAEILRVLETLLEPTLGLQVEVTDAVNRVLTGQVEGRYKIPKRGFEKFMETYKEVKPVLDFVINVLKEISGK